MAKQPGSLTEIVYQEGTFYEDPAYANVLPSAMPQVGVQGFRARRTQEDGAQNGPSFGVMHQLIVRVIGIDSQQHGHVPCDLENPTNRHQGKPDQNKRNK